MLRYHFMKLGPQTWEAMANGTGTDDPHHDAAWVKFISAYDLPEYRLNLHSAAVRDLAAADQAGRVPKWALSLLEADEIKRIEEVKKQR